MLNTVRPSQDWHPHLCFLFRMGTQPGSLHPYVVSPNRLIPILVNGMKYSEIDIILLKVSQGCPQLAMGGQGRGCWVAVSSQR